MNIVSSKWEAIEGRENDWQELAARTGPKLRAIDGVEFLHRFQNESGQVVVTMGYTDEPTYQRLVNDPNGAVAQMMADTGIESMARWISSERGESVD
jgi:hypothetical protein